MAYDRAAKLPRHYSHGLRSLDHLEASVRAKPERLPGHYRLRVHGAIRKGGDHRDSIRAWAILAVASPTTVAASAIIANWRHW